MSEIAKEIESLVVRLPNWVGDAAMATAALRSLRLGYPGARIVLQGREKILGLLEGLASYDEVLPLRKGTRESRLSFLAANARALRSDRFDMGLLMPNSFSSALLFFLGGVGKRTGYAINGRGFLLHRSIPLSAQLRKRNPEPMTEHYLRIARFAGGAETGPETELAVTPRCEEEAEAFLERSGLRGARPLVGLNPGSSFGPSKCWRPERFAVLSDWVHESLGGRTVLLCGPGEEEAARVLCGAARFPVVDTSRSVLPLDVLKSVMRRLDLLVTTDSGPRHIAVAFKVPVVVLMGPTDPRYTASNLDRTRVVRLDLDCSPCHKRECDRGHPCMLGITPGMVMDEVSDLLASPAVKGQRHD